MDEERPNARPGTGREQSNRPANTRPENGESAATQLWALGGLRDRTSALELTERFVIDPASNNLRAFGCQGCAEAEFCNLTALHPINATRDLYTGQQAGRSNLSSRANLPSSAIPEARIANAR